MKIISFDQIQNLNISPQLCYEWVTQAINMKKRALLPAKISLKPDIPGVFYNTMPVIIPEVNLAGVKVVTRYPLRKPSLDSEILLYNLSTGECIAIMDGNWITAMRTGAVAAHSVHLLAKKDFSVIGMIGLGNTARATLKVLLKLYAERHFTIKVKCYKEQERSFIQEFKDNSYITFVVCETNEEVVDQSDVVISAVTVSEHNICDDQYFKEGVLVVPIHTRGFMNCDLFFNKVFADDREHVKNFKYFQQFKCFAEVSEVVECIKPGRETDKERIIVYNIGIALHDIYFAGKIYQMLNDCSKEFWMNVPNEKFWV